MLIQTAAIFLDAYRELNAKKLFWITLIISCVVVVAFSLVGINSKGITLLWYEFPSIANTTLIPRPTFYKLLFSWLGIGFWQNWFGTILALVSTAGIIPDFIAGGSVDLYLSKPISRLRLFLTKYLTGLVFVALQVTFFSAACFVLIGIRAGSWDFRIFLAVPVSLLVFSYLFSVCALLGLLTRSTVAAMLLTILFWLLIFGIDTASTRLLKSTLAGKIENQAYQNQFSYSDKQLAMIQDRITDKSQPPPQQLIDAQDHRRKLEEKKRLSDPSRESVASAYSMLAWAQAILPKTGQTDDLLVRWLSIDTRTLEETAVEHRERHRAARDPLYLLRFQDRTEVAFDDAEVLGDLEDIQESKSATKIIGSSLLFELVILTFTCWIFARRDY